MRRTSFSEEPLDSRFRGNVSKKHGNDDLGQRNHFAEKSFHNFGNFRLYQYLPVIPAKAGIE
jgi:hypothetical protein